MEKITFSVMSCDFYRPFLNWLFFTAAQLAARLREYQMFERISTGTKEKELTGLTDINAYRNYRGMLKIGKRESSSQSNFLDIPDFQSN